jgi:hypothetical protein
MRNDSDDPDSLAAPPEWLARTAATLREYVAAGQIGAGAAADAVALLGTIEAERLLAPVPSVDGGAITFVWPAYDRTLSAVVLSRWRLRLGIEAGGQVVVRGECGPVVLRRELATLYPYLQSRWAGGAGAA